MRIWNLVPAAILMLLAACGGGSDGSQSSNQAQSGTGAAPSSSPSGNSGSASSAPSSAPATNNSPVVSGTVIGIAGANNVVGLSLSEGGFVTQTWDATDGPFSFPFPVTIGKSIDVSVSSNPLEQTCTVLNGSGTMPAAGISITVTCGITQGTPNGHSVPLTVESYGSVPLVNAAYTSVTVCPPGSGNCATIDHVIVDTGSVGLRLTKQALDASGVSLPAYTTSASAGGLPLSECVEFGSGMTFGPLLVADVHLGDEVASSIPINEVLDLSTTSVNIPSNCASTRQYALGNGANGILGIRPALYDSGAYYTCAADWQTCADANSLDYGSNVPNPIGQFSQDANGYAIEMNSLPSGGAATSVAGTLTFGLGTQEDNGLPATVNVLQIQQEDGYLINASINGASTSLIFDTGTNIQSVTDSQLPTCALDTWLYCPSSLTTVPIQVTTATGSTTTLQVYAQNMQSFVSGADVAIGSLMGPSSQAGMALLGMPFFYGRTIYFALEGSPTTAGLGPFTALSGSVVVVGGTAGAW